MPVVGGSSPGNYARWAADIQQGIPPTAAASAAGSVTFDSSPVSSIVMPGPVGQAAGSWSPVFREDFTGSSVQVVDATNALVKFSPGGPTWQGWWPVKNLSNDNSYQVGLQLEWYDLSALSLDGVSTLTITATHDNIHSANGTSYPYTSGMIHTSGFFNQKYGYFECKMKCPSGGGNWPAFWTLPSTFNPHTPPEIDIFENFGNPDSHKASNWGANSTVIGDVIAVDVTQWHVYGLKWTSNSLVWYIDGVAKATEGTLSAIPTVAQFLLVTLGVRGTDLTTYTTQVDYMAAWK